MLKNDFIRHVAQASQGSQSVTEKQVALVFETISQILERGDDLRWAGFGRFALVHKAARQGRNPQTGKSIKIAAKAIPVFKPATALKARIQQKVKTKPKATKSIGARRTEPEVNRSRLNPLKENLDRGGVI